RRIGDFIEMSSEACAGGASQPESYPFGARRASGRGEGPRRLVVSRQQPPGHLARYGRPLQCRASPRNVALPQAAPQPAAHRLRTRAAHACPIRRSTMHAIHSLLVANRSEIAIRVMRAAAELGMRTVAIYSHEDRFALHRFKADESYLVGEGRKPLQAYLDVDDIIRIARRAKVDAIHPGYGFLSENPDFARACEAAGIVFVGPTPDVMTTLGNKVAARAAAVAAGVPVMPATGPLPVDPGEARRLAE